MWKKRCFDDKLYSQSTVAHATQQKSIVCVDLCRVKGRLSKERQSGGDLTYQEYHRELYLLDHKNLTVLLKTKLCIPKLKRASPLLISYLMRES